MRRAIVAVISVLVLTGCQGSPAAPGESDVDVDTPRLQQMKGQADIAPCVPGPGGGDLPDLTLACLGGGADVNLASLQGPLLINLWASYCTPCRTEMPALQAFYQQYGDQVGVLGIDWVDTYPEAAIALAEETGATYPQLADPGGELLEQDDVPIPPGVPQFIVIDADGAVVKQASGGLDSEQEVVDLVEDALGITL